MVGLGVNIDHVATIRQARQTVEPDPVWAASMAELAGADCITFHLRCDRRHINDRDAELLVRGCRVKSNMEMSLADEIVEMALKLKPGQATLVPENRQEVTTEGGLDVVSNLQRVKDVTARLQDAGIEVSAFIDAELDQIQASKACGCEAIEIHTGRYANAVTKEEIEATLADMRRAVNAGIANGLIVHGGHGLNYTNVQQVAAIDGFCEFNIGHSIISRSVFVGLTDAVKTMKNLICAAAR